MTRGRKKDLTIPPTRSLVQQRDYRARKANYIASLEERCRKAEEENIELRNELMQAKGRLANPAVILPETVEASQELMHNLALATASLSKFQQLAFADTQSSSEASSSRSPQAQGPSETQFQQQPSPAMTESSFQPQPLQGRNPNRPGRKQLFRDDSPTFSPGSHRTSSEGFRSPSPDSSSECCGGILDCDALGCDGIIEQEGHMAGGTRSRLSGLRSTSMSDCRL
ncbi:hypothetical protein GALMADRAFT_227000 [Galerina marginata CBS 339.88]|uniref:BZIP domain-containing protein n=1 Tax=Galerina marginata (strain CBS 339.88) TaxID=685588 RepID=A0A067SZ32_GALM3|nr:hypothetical protein GALMADRAFT_227000 [Galerina marginata CBS 339.88]